MGHPCIYQNCRPDVQADVPKFLPYSSFGIRRSLLVTSNGVKWSPSYMCKPGYFFLCILKHDHNDLGVMRDLVRTAVLPNDLHLALLRGDSGQFSVELSQIRTAE